MQLGEQMTRFQMVRCSWCGGRGDRGGTKTCRGRSRLASCILSPPSPRRFSVRSKPHATPIGSPGFQSGRDLLSGKAAVKFTAGSEEKARPLRAKQAPSKWSTCPSTSVAMSTAAKAQGLTACSGFQSVVHEKSRRPSPREDSGRAEPEG